MHKILILSATHAGDMKSVENSKQCSFAWLPPDGRQPQPPGNRLLQMCFRCARISFFGMPFAIARHSNTGNTACQTKAKWFKHPTRRSDFQKFISSLLSHPVRDEGREACMLFGPGSRVCVCVFGITWNNPKNISSSSTLFLCSLCLFFFLLLLVCSMRQCTSAILTAS